MPLEILFRCPYHRVHIAGEARILYTFDGPAAIVRGALHACRYTFNMNINEIRVRILCFVATAGVPMTVRIELQAPRNYYSSSEF